mgnify:CR=1 FL=1
MRPLLLPGLLDAAARNASYGRPDASYFESAHVYRMAGPLDSPGGDGSPGGAMPAVERHHAAVLVPGDFFAAKGILEGLMDSLRVAFDDSERRSRGLAARRDLAGNVRGAFGVVDTLLAGGYDGPVHFDYKPARTEDEDGVWVSAAGPFFSSSMVNAFVFWMRALDYLASVSPRPRTPVMPAVPS